MNTDTPPTQPGTGEQRETYAHPRPTPGDRRAKKTAAPANPAQAAAQQLLKQAQGPGYTFRDIPELWYHRDGGAIFAISQEVADAHNNRNAGEPTPEIIHQVIAVPQRGKFLRFTAVYLEAFSREAALAWYRGWWAAGADYDTLAALPHRRTQA